MVFPVILQILAGLAIAATVVVIVYLKWDDIVDWFMGRQKLVEKDKAHVAFVVKEKMNSGKFTVVQGIFNKNTEKVVDARKIEAEELDSKLESCEELTIFQ